MLRILLCMVRFSRVTRRTLRRIGRTLRHLLILTHTWRLQIYLLADFFERARKTFNQIPNAMRMSLARRG